MANKIKRIKPRKAHKTRAGEAKKTTSIEREAKKASHIFYRGEFEKAAPQLVELAKRGWMPANRLLYWTYIHMNEGRAARFWARAGMKGGDPVCALLWSLGDVEEEKAALYEEWSEKAWEQAKQGDFLAMCALAPWAIERAEEKSIVELIRMLEKPDVQRCFLVFETLGNLYSAPGSALDLQKAVDYYTTAANMGDTTALKRIGDIYSDQTSNLYDTQQAVQYIQKAADAGNYAALVQIADMYMNGEGVPQDTQNALKYYRKAVERVAPDNPEAEWIHLGSVYDKPGEVDNWPQLALASFSERSSTKNVELLEQVAMLMISTFEVTKDWTDVSGKLVDYLNRATELGSTVAPGLLGFTHERGLCGVPVDTKQAKEFFEEGTRRGDAESYTALGRLYEEGVGVEQDICKARELYEKGAQMGSTLALRHLGRLYGSVGIPGEDNAQNNHEKALQYYNKAIDAGDTEAWYYLGDYYLHEAPEDMRDIDKGVECLRKAAENGSAKASTELGYIYYSGALFGKDEDKAFAYLQEAADRGDAVGQYLLGMCYLQGVGVEPDEDEGKEWLCVSAGQGFPAAWTRLADLLVEEATDCEDLREALRCYQKAASLGEGTAYIKLARLYQRDDCDLYNIDKALETLETGAAQGYGACCVELGSMYFSGKGVEVDFEKGVEWYREGAQLNDLTCMLELARAYADGEGVPTDDEKGLEYLRLAAQQGSPQAAGILELAEENKSSGKHTPLGEMLRTYAETEFGKLQEALAPYTEQLADVLRAKAEEGEDYSPEYLDDLAESLGFTDSEDLWAVICSSYERAGESGSASAWLKLADLYQKGENIDEDWEKALKCYERAAECGDPEGWMFIADAYYEGNGPEPDATKAIEYYKKAIDAGYETAWNAIGTAYARGLSGEVDGQAARECFMKATAAGDGIGWVNLGQMYETGLGGKRDEKKAFECYRRGAQDGLPLAWQLLSTCYEAGIGVTRNLEKAYQCMVRAERLYETRGDSDEYEDY